jgi:hypothetical protein
MRKPVLARSAAFVFILGFAVAHCGGDDSSTTSGGSTGSGGGTTSATTGSQTTTTAGAGTTSSTSAGAGGFGGTTGTGGGGGASIGNCPASQPGDGTSCTAFAACPYGSVVCVCFGMGGGARSWTCPDLDGFSFDANFGRPDAGP